MIPSSTSKYLGNGDKSLGKSLDELVAEIDQKAIELDASDKKSHQPPSAPPVGKPFRGQYIRFLLDKLILAIPLSRVLEIGHRPDVTPLPNLPEWIIGVSNIRGEIISIVDLKAYLGMPSHGLTRDSRLMIIRHLDMKVGAIVDKILGIFSTERIEQDIQESPFQKGEIASYIDGVIQSDDGLINFLNVEKLLTSPKMNAFRGE